MFATELFRKVFSREVGHWGKAQQGTEKEGFGLSKERNLESKQFFSHLSFR